MPENKSLKLLAENFLKLAASGKVDEAYTKYVGRDFIHHNQYYKGDRESLMLGMKESASKFTDKSLEVKTTLQEGNKVMTYSHITMNPNEMEIAVFTCSNLRMAK